jgi:hypothetical protein
MKIKLPPALKFSLLLNFLLLALAAWLLRPVPSPARAVFTQASSPHAAGETDLKASAPASLLPFRWSQLESTNYLTYIANLRAIGCPAQTVRDLIVADVDSLYAPKREKLLDQEAQTGQDLGIQRQALQQEESDLIARLLGLPPRRSPPPSADSGVEARVQSPKTSMPLAFLDADTNFVQLDDRQQAIIARLRQGFADEVGGQSADPSSPEYAERWRKAQPEYDEMLQTLVGQEAFVELQREAARPGQSP